MICPIRKCFRQDMLKKGTSTIGLDMLPEAVQDRRPIYRHEVLLLPTITLLPNLRHDFKDIIDKPIHEIVLDTIHTTTHEKCIHSYFWSPLRLPLQ